MTEKEKSMKIEVEIVESIREETPGCGHVCHLNNAGCSLPSRQTLQTVIDYLHMEATIGVGTLCPGRNIE